MQQVLSYSVSTTSDAVVLLTLNSNLHTLVAVLVTSELFLIHC